MTDRFEEMAERVLLDLACTAYGGGRRRIVADALRVAHVGGVDEAAFTIDRLREQLAEHQESVLEREERRSRVAAFIEAEKEYGASVLADSFGAFPDLDLSPDPHEAPWQDERDTRAERIGEAAIAAGDTLRFAIDLAVDEIRNGEGFDDRDIPKLRAIAAAMEDEA